LYNNEVNTEGLPDPDGKSPTYGYNKPTRKGEVLGAWKDVQTYSSPLWVGYKANGSVHRFGYSHPLVQDVTQNGIHKYFGPGKTNYFNRYDNFQYGPYSYIGYNNPFSLW
jgi:hypothetical protein